MERLIDIVKLLSEVHVQTQQFAVAQVNQGLTLRNWLFGYYLAEHELSGQRADYGKEHLKNIANALSEQGIKGMTHSALYRFQQFYQCYPQIFATVSQRLQYTDIKLDKISATVSRKSEQVTNAVDSDKLVSRLNYSHFLELIKVENPVKRQYYELCAIKEHWSVRELRRAINTMVYERSGLSAEPKISGNQPEISQSELGGIIRSPLLLEFLDIPEKAEFSESDLEQAIIHKLQDFLMELGRGFCFEARQKRITFDNKHYFIDLVFYHRILKCHVLIDLKLGEFSHADAGQMNLYLNYYKENEMEQGDNPPIGIVLCANKNDELVHYATGGLSKELFVGRYMLSLPSEKELIALIRQETLKLNKS